MKKYVRAIGAILLLTVTLAIASDARDPFIERVSRLSSLFDQTFLDVKLAQDLAGGKVYVPIPRSDPRYQHVIAEMKKFKNELRSESERRSSQPFGSAGLEALTAAAGQYLDIQARLYPLYAKNAHQDSKGTSIYSFNELDELNLLIHVKVGLPFATNTALKRQYNVRHYKTANWTELFVSENEKRSAEYAALLHPRDSHEYSKLVQLATIQETMVNRWAVRRLQTLPLHDQKISSCGPELLSFRLDGASSLDESKTYQSLLVDDNYLVFSHLKETLRTASLDQPLASALDYSRIGRKVFDAFPEFTNVKAPLFRKQPDGEATLKRFFDENVPRNLSENEATTWLGRSTDVIQGVNFPADDLSSHAIAQRIAEVEYRERKRSLIETLLNQLKNTDITEVTTKPEASTARIVSIVEAELAPAKAAWLSQQENTLALAFEKNETHALKTEIVESRIKKIYQNINEDARDAIRAQVVLSRIEKFAKDGVPLVKTNQNFYVRTYERDLKQRVLLDKVATHEVLTDFVSPFSVGQLSRYFNTTLTKLDDGANLFDKRTATAKKIAKSPLLSRYMEKFFKALQKDFDKALKDRKIEHLTALNSPLEPLIGPVAARTLNDLKTAMGKGSKSSKVHTVPHPPKSSPSLKAPVAPELWAFHPLVVAQADHTRMAPRAVYKEIKPDDTVSDDDKRLENIKIFTEALSWLGYSAGHPVALSKIGSTVLDQESIALAIINEAFVKVPILQIDVRGFSDTDDGNRTRGIQFMADAYEMKQHRLDFSKAKESLTRLVAFAARNDQGKLEDFCKANPTRASSDKNMAKVFLASSSIRSVLKDNNKIISALDEELRKQTRTFTEKALEDVLDPLATYAFYIMLLSGAATFAIAAAPTAWAILVTGISVAPAAAATAVTATSMLSSVFFGNLGAVDLIFITQGVAQVRMNYYELPPQLSYQIGVANSQIGSGQMVASREDILRANEKLTTDQFYSVANVLSFVGCFKPVYGSAKLLFKADERAALSRLAGADAVKTALVPTRLEIASAPFQEMVREKGIFEATQTRALRLLHEIHPLPGKFNMTEEAVAAALSKKLSMEIGEVSHLRKAYQHQISEDETLIEKLTQKIQETGDRYRPAPGTRLGTEGASAMTERFSRLKLYAHVVKYRWRVAVGKLPYEKIAGAAMPIEWKRLPEMSFFASVAEIKALKDRIAYFERATSRLEASTLAGGLNQQQMLEHHFSELVSDPEQLRLHEELFTLMKDHSIRSSDTKIWEQTVKSFGDYHAVIPHLVEKVRERWAQPDLMIDEGGNFKEAGTAGRTADYEDYEMLIINADGTAAWEKVNSAGRKAAK